MVCIIFYGFINTTYKIHNPRLRWATSGESGHVLGAPPTRRRRSQNPHHCDRPKES